MAWVNTRASRHACQELKYSGDLPDLGERPRVREVPADSCPEPTEEPGGLSDGPTLQPDLNDPLVPRGIFLASPLGQALLNSSNASINVSEIHGPGGSDVSFDPQLWANRTLNSSDNLPIASNPDFIWVFSNTSQLQNGSTSGAWGGIPGSPPEAGNDSREVQAVVWVNVTPTSSLGSAAAQLQDLFEGLMLTLAQNLSSNTSSWNVTNDIVGGITSELPTLGLPTVVMATLAIATIASNGSYGPPRYNATQASLTGWQLWGEQLWNTITGVATWVVDGITYVASALWSVSAGAQAYLGGALKGALASATHGLESFGSQTWAALKGVEGVMEWALEQAASVIVQRILKPAFQPLINLDIDYTEAEASALVTLDSTAFWSGWGGSLFILAIGLAAAVTIALAIIQNLFPGAALIALLIAGLVVSGSQIVANNHRSDFIGLNPLSAPIVTQLRSILLPASGSELDTDLSDLSALLGAITTTWAVEGVETAATPPPIPLRTDAWGSALGIMALLTASAAQTLESVGAAVVSLVFDVASLIVDSVALLSPTADYLQDGVTLLLDAAAAGLDARVALDPGAW